MHIYINEVTITKTVSDFSRSMKRKWGQPHPLLAIELAIIHMNEYMSHKVAPAPAAVCCSDEKTLLCIRTRYLREDNQD